MWVELRSRSENGSLNALRKPVLSFAIQLDKDE